jgi:amino acid transporter
LRTGKLLQACPNWNAEIYANNVQGCYFHCQINDPIGKLPLVLEQSMNFASGIPVLFGFVMYTGGPTAAFANWTMVGGLSFIVSLSMAEIAAALPTAGGIYYWAYRLGGPKWGYRFLTAMPSIYLALI